MVAAERDALDVAPPAILQRYVPALSVCIVTKREESPMQQINFRVALTAVLAILAFNGCSHDPPSLTDSPKSVSIVTAANNL